MRPVSLRESANSSTPPVTRPRGLSGCGATWSTRTRSLGVTGRVVMGVAVATPTSVAAVTDLLPFRRRVRSPAALPSRPAMVVSFVELQSDGQTPLAPLAPMGVSRNLAQGVAVATPWGATPSGAVSYTHLTL